jgi:transcriptional regulator with XRE-family HTH domain
LFFWAIGNKTVKELRRKKGLTAHELAMRSRLETVDILKIDDTKLKNVPEPLKTKIAPILKMRWF